MLRRLALGVGSPQATKVVPVMHTLNAIVARRLQLHKTSVTQRPHNLSPPHWVNAPHRQYSEGRDPVIASVTSATILGARGYSVQVEVHVGRGLPGFSMLGLPDEACREARDRVRAAVLSSGLNWPDQKITVNLAPPHHRKTGSGLDLPIALGVLLATQQLRGRVA
jgi:hypothetical protein